MENTDKLIFKHIWIQIQAFSCRKIQRNRTQSNILFDLIDFCIFIVFLTATTIVSLSNREISLFHYGNAIQKQFIDRTFYNEYGFEMTYKDMITVADWWSFIETTFFENISKFEQSDNKSFAVLENHILLGVPRLRQIRVENATCSIHDAFRNQFQTCYGEFTKSKEDANAFFQITQSTYISSYPIWGKISTYNGADYIETLSSAPDENEALLKRLKAMSWIDRGTRIVLIEFITYNANVNLLCNIKMLVEFTTCGGILTSSSIQPLSYFVLCQGFSECFCVLLLFIIILFYTFELVLRVKILGYFNTVNSIWIIFDAIVVLLPYLFLFYFVWLSKYLEKFLDLEDEQNKDVFSLDVAFYWNMCFNTGMGIYVFIVWIQIFKYIQLNKTMLKFSLTIRRCAESLFGFVVMFAIVFTAYADLSVLLFGATHADFHDFSTAMLTMIRMVLGDLYYSEMEETSPVLGPMYFLSYILFVFFILLNMFLAIINDTFSRINSEKTLGKNEELKELKNKLLNKIKRGPFATQKQTIFSNKLSTNASRNDRAATKKINVVNSFLRVIPKQKTTEDLNELNKRILVLEKTIDNLLTYLDNAIRPN